MWNNVLDPVLLLPPSPSNTKNTLILDLDNTLIYAVTDKPTSKNSYDFQVEVTTNAGVCTCYVLKRPGVDMLLQKISKLDFEIVAFTTACREYASKVLDLIDPEGVIAHRLYRDSCKIIGRKIFKDLTCLGRKMDRIVAVDDQPRVYLFESRPITENVFPVSEFTGKNLDQDQQLQGVVEFLEYLANSTFTDTREAIRQHRERLNGQRKRML